MDAISTGPTCDRCGPSVAARVRYVRGVDIWEFCQHDARVHERALLAMGFERQDISDPAPMSPTTSRIGL